MQGAHPLPRQMVRHARSRGGPVHIRLRARKGAGAAEVKRALVHMGAQPPWSSGWWWCGVLAGGCVVGGCVVAVGGHGNGGLFPFRLYPLLHLDLGIWHLFNAAPLLVALLSVSVSHSERRLPFLFPSFSDPTTAS